MIAQASDDICHGWPGRSAANPRNAAQSHASTALAPCLHFRASSLLAFLGSPQGATPQDCVRDHIKAWRASSLGVGWGESLDIFNLIWVIKCI